MTKTKEIFLCFWIPRRIKFRSIPVLNNPFLSNGRKNGATVSVGLTTNIQSRSNGKANGTVTSRVSTILSGRSSNGKNPGIMVLEASTTQSPNKWSGKKSGMEAWLGILIIRSNKLFGFALGITECV